MGTPSDRTTQRRRSRAQEPCLAALARRPRRSRCPLPPSAVVTCNFAAGTATVTLASGDVATLSVNGAVIQANGAACGAATTANTDTINVVGAAGAETVVVDLSGGQFAPGASVEPSGLSEIEIAVNLAGGTDTLTFQGSAGADAALLRQPGESTSPATTTRTSRTSPSRTSRSTETTAPMSSTAAGATRRAFPSPAR